MIRQVVGVGSFYNFLAGRQPQVPNLMSEKGVFRNGAILA